LSLLFLDTSALAKRYLVEIGSIWVMGLAQPAAGNVLVMADLATVEMASLLARRVREGTLPAANATLLLREFLRHAEREYLSVPQDTNVLTLARALVERYPLRALDAIQLASAQRAGSILGEPLTFIASDRNLLTAAAAANLVIDDPLGHP
jgi:predicted nucleic acid-binding protein